MVLLQLQQAVTQRAPGVEVAGQARQLAERLRQIYQLSLLPAITPDPQRGQALYAEQCSVCHGNAGAVIAEIALHPFKGDPHRLAVYNQFMAGTTPFEFTKNYKFTVLNNENVWAKAMNRVLNEKVPVDKAVDEMIARIKVVAAN